MTDQASNKGFSMTWLTVAGVLAAAGAYILWKKNNAQKKAEMLKKAADNPTASTTEGPATGGALPIKPAAGFAPDINNPVPGAQINIPVGYDMGPVKPNLEIFTAELGPSGGITYREAQQNISFVDNLNLVDNLDTGSMNAFK